ncbi:MAG: hypothetical protein AAF628_30905 [Planctomycetota bacterium]
MRRGDRIELEMSYDNNGSSSQKPKVRFYLLTNHFISTGDQEIASRHDPAWTGPDRPTWCAWMVAADTPDERGRRGGKLGAHAFGSWRT